MIEPLSGGLVTARDPSLLEVGELQACSNLTYHPGDLSLYKTSGHAAHNTTALTHPLGLRYCSFDQGGDYLVALAGTSLYTANANLAADFSSLTSLGGAGAALDSAYFTNRHYLFTGVGPNQTLLKDGTIRRMGMPAVNTPPGAAITTGAGTWPLATTDTLPAYYEYWVTEVYKNGDEEVEGTFTGQPQTVYIPASDTYVTITHTVSSPATHWRVYRGERKQYASDQSFPVGWKIAEVKANETTFKDGLPTTTSLTLPTTALGTLPRFANRAYRDDTLRDELTPGQASYMTFNEWTTPSNILLADGNTTTSPTLTAATFDSNFQPPRPTYQWTAVELGTFGLGTIGAPVTNFTAEVKGLKTGTGIAQLYASSDAGTTLIPFGAQIPFTTGSATYSINCTIFNHVWTGDQVTDTNFKLYLIAIANVQTTYSVTVDYVKIQVTHSGATSSETVPFPFLTVTESGIEYRIGSNNAPPVSETGDVFDSSMVVNDISNPSIVRYSLAQQPEYFPSQYFVSFDTEARDKVRAIKTLGNLALIGTYTQLFRMDYLPRAEDLHFRRGRALDKIAGAHGVIGPKAICLFNNPGFNNGGLMAAYISRSGPMMSEGYTATTLTDDLDWEATGLRDINNLELVNDARFYRLRLLANDHEYHFHYHPVHQKNGKLKVTGPHATTAISGAPALFSDGSEALFTLGSNGIAYRENVGVGPAAPSVKTREIYPAGPGEKTKIVEVLVHQGGSTNEMSLTPEIAQTNDVARTRPATILPASSRGFIRAPITLQGEGFAFTLAQAAGDDPLRLNYLVLQGVSPGMEQSLK